MYDEVSVEKCEVEIEKSLVKLRWGRMGHGSDGVYSEDSDSDEEEEIVDFVSTDISDSDVVSLVPSHVPVVSRSRSNSLDFNTSSRSGESSEGDNDTDISITSSNCLSPVSSASSLLDHDTSTFNADCDVSITSSNCVSILSDTDTSVLSHTPTPSVISIEEDRVWPYDPAKKTLDLRYLRSTDLPFNRYVHLPDLLESAEEVTIQNLRNNLVREAQDYVSEKERLASMQGGSDGRPASCRDGYMNLTEEETEGLRRLSVRKDAVVFTTDKSGRFAVDSKANYAKASLPHIQDDPIVSEEECAERDQCPCFHVGTVYPGS